MEGRSLSENEAYQEFQTIFNKSMALLPLRKIGERRKPILELLDRLPQPPPLPKLPRLGPLPQLPTPDELKKELTDWAARVDTALCEYLVVAAVTALEVYLGELYRGVSGEPWRGHKLENTREIDKCSKELSQKFGVSLRPFKEVDSDQLQEFFDLRHVIVHRGGKVDKYIKVKEQVTAHPGQLTKDILTLEKTGALLDRAKACADSVHRQYCSAAH